MKALVARRYGGPDVLTIEEVAMPVPGAGDVLVRNHASVVTAAVCAARSGSPFMTRLYFGLRRPKWPILGTNFSGVVEAVGGSVTRFRVGERVSGVNVKDFGAHAEYISVPEDGVIAPTPTTLSDEEAVAVFDGSLTALPFLRDTAGLRPGQSVLVIGASGAVGTAAIQLARHYGATVTAVCSTANLELVKSLGADAAIDYTIEDFTRNLAAYDVIFDAVAASSFRRSKRALTRDGVYLTTVPSPAILLQTLWTRRIGRRKAAIAFTGLARPAEMAKNLVFVGRLADSGEFVPVIDTTHPLERAADAHRHVDTRHKTGSAVLTIGV